MKNKLCDNCKKPIKYNNQLAFCYDTEHYHYACCVKCRRKNVRLIRAKKSID